MHWSALLFSHFKGHCDLILVLCCPSQVVFLKPPNCRSRALFFVSNTLHTYCVYSFGTVGS